MVFPHKFWRTFWVAYLIFFRPQYVWFLSHLYVGLIPNSSGQLAELIVFVIPLEHICIVTRARFLSLVRSKLRLCSANHRPGYWSNLPCDWPSTAWAYSQARDRKQALILLLPHYQGINELAESMTCFLRNIQFIVLWTRLLTFYWWHFQKCFCEWKCLNNLCDFIKMYSCGFNWQYVRFSFGNGLAPNRWQAIL